MRSIALIAGLLFSLPSWAAKQTVWWELKPTLHLSKEPIPAGVCEMTEACTEFYIGADLDGAKITRLRLESYPHHRGAELTAAEIAAVKLYPDTEGNFWLKELPLPKRLVGSVVQGVCWAFSLGNELAKLDLGGPTLPIVFDAETVGEFKPYAKTPIYEFTGSYKDGSTFFAHLKMKQYRWTKGE
jgi:hypothetical protein